MVFGSIIIWPESMLFDSILSMAPEKNKGWRSREDACFVAASHVTKRLMLTAIVYTSKST